MSVNENVNTNRYVYRETEQGIEALHCKAGVLGRAVTMNQLKPYLESLGLKTTHKQINGITTGTSNHTIYHKEGLLVHYKLMSLNEKVYLMVFIYELPYYKGVISFNKLPSNLMKTSVTYYNKISSGDIIREFNINQSTHGTKMSMHVLSSILCNPYFAKQVESIDSDNRTEIFLRYNHINRHNEAVLYNSKFKRHRIFVISDLTVTDNLYTSSVFNDKYTHVTKKAIVTNEEFITIQEAVKELNNKAVVTK